MKKQIHIFAGHFGSGKTETALSFAKKQRRAGKSVVIIDIDTVNPYFRTNDAAPELEALGIRLISNGYASTNLDMPIVSPAVYGVFEGSEDIIVFDVGGDEDGAYALGQYKNFFDRYGYSMHFVINTKRPLTSDADELLDMAREIEAASRLKFTDIYNNTNLSRLTDTAVLFSGAKSANELSKKMNIPVAYHCGTKDVISGLPADMPVFETEITIRMPFEEGEL
jgi:hypothetical protein